jgi:hypothetical protein
MAGTRLPLHRIVGALAGLLALEFVGERRQRQHDLVGRRVERPFSVLQVKEHAHTRLDQLLERVGGFDRFAAQPGFFRHEHLERRPRFQRVHQAQEAGPVRKLGAADAVVNIHVLVGNDPALANGVRPRVLDLPRDAFLIVGNVLRGGLANINRGNHLTHSPILRT